MGAVAGLMGSSESSWLDSKDEQREPPGREMGEKGTRKHGCRRRVETADRRGPGGLCPPANSGECLAGLARDVVGGCRTNQFLPVHRAPSGRRDRAVRKAETAGDLLQHLGRLSTELQEDNERRKP